MTRVDLDAVERRAKYFRDSDVGYDPNVPALVAELRAAREVIGALHAWEAMDGMFFGHTPRTGGDVGRALIAYEKAVGS